MVSTSSEFWYKCWGVCAGAWAVTLCIWLMSGIVVFWYISLCFILFAICISGIGYIVGVRRRRKRWSDRERML